MKTSQKGFIGIILIIIIALTVGVGATYYVAKDKKGVENSVDTDTNTKVDGSKQNPTATVTADIKADVQMSVPQLSIPKGKYQYVELTGSGAAAQTWVYELNVSKDGGVGNITLNIDGFQTMTEINAVGRASQGSLEVVFDSYGSNNMFTPYKKGDVLFTLKPTSAGLAFEWKKMEPYLPGSVYGGYFVKK